MVVEPDRDRQDPVDRLLGGLDLVLDTVHDRIIRPLLVFTRYLAFGLLLLSLGLVILVAGTIGLIRFSDVFIFQGYVWVSYLVVGFLFVVAGLLVWRKRRPVTERSS